MNQFFYFLAAFSSLLSSVAFAATSSIEGLGEVETTVTWMTVRKPEVNFLIHNKTDRALPFSVTLLLPNDSETNGCAKREIEVLDAGRRQWTLSAPRETGNVVFGMIPPRSWAHRLFVPTGTSFRPPCKISYYVIFEHDEDKKISGNVQISELEPNVDRGSASVPKIVSTAMVEEDAFQDHLLVRLLIQNVGDVVASVWVSDRSIVCPEGRRVEWSTQWPVLQGEDIGPVDIGPKSWAVLVSALRVMGGGSAKNCKGYIELSYPKDGGWLRLERRSFDLTPRAKFSFEPVN